MPSLYSGVSTGANDFDVTALSQGMMDVYSLDVLHNAQGIMRYEEVCVRKTELMRAPGETVKFTKYNDITRGGQLNEEDSLSTNKMSASQISVSVTEWGNAIGVSEKLLQLSFDDQMAEASLLLGRDYAVVRDLAVRDVAAAGGTTTLFTNPSAGVLGDINLEDKFDIETIRLGIEALHNVNAPKFFNDFFICMIHPHQAAHLRRDPDWVSAHNYHGTRALFSGELGRWEDVVFISTTHQGNGAAASTEPGYEAGLVGTGNDGQNLYRATLFADQAIAIADALPVELRDDGVTDFGRKHALAWYAIFGVGILEDDFLVQILSS